MQVKAKRYIMTCSSEGIRYKIGIARLETFGQVGRFTVSTFRSASGYIERSTRPHACKKGSPFCGWLISGLPIKCHYDGPVERQPRDEATSGGDSPISLPHMLLCLLVAVTFSALFRTGSGLCFWVAAVWLFRLAACAVTYSARVRTLPGSPNVMARPAD